LTFLNSYDISTVKAYALNFKHEGREEMATRITKRDYEHLAKLKVQEKEIKEQISELQSKIFSSGKYAEEYPTSHGTLKVQKRANISVPDNNKLIQKSDITQAIFINSATISASNVKKIVGENKFNDLLKKGVLKDKGDTYFYKLNGTKKGETA